MVWVDTAETEEEVAANRVEPATDRIPGGASVGIDVPQRVVPGVGVAVPPLRVERVLLPCVNRIHAGETSDLGFVVPGPEVVEAGLGIALFARELAGLAGAEAGVRSARPRRALLAERQVVVPLDDVLLLVGDCADVADHVGVVV